ncbi:MAG: restriction endonuclease [Elusimicrobia bacterium RIFOXYB2_FULL_48_7]|nr:MAG: restriction endonuclease [Elusimicrobia bacterium RIFOXYB2_FULL_48_7]
MPIPDYQTIMLPLLKFTSDNKEHSKQDTVDNLAKSFNLTAEELKELLPSGQQAIFDNRVGWARTYLKKAGLLESTRRGFFRITKRGSELIEQKPKEINNKLLEKYPEFINFREKSKKDRIAEKNDRANAQFDSETPEETLEIGYQKLRQNLSIEILEQIKHSSPVFFEKLVVELLVKMGYGGSRKDAGKAIGSTGDGGIDGIIKEDKLGLDIIYIQAKRWEGVVGRPEIQKFAGALQGQRAKKGIFITTSSFTKDALEYAKNIDIKIILIDGDQLSEHMIDSDIGVAKIASYEIKRIDSDYFSEE